MSVRHYHRHRSNNILLSFLGFVLAILLSRLPFFNSLVVSDTIPIFLRAFIAGLLFTSTFTLAIGSLVLIKLIAIFPLPLLVLFGGLGALVGDILIFSFVKDKVSDEITPVYEHFFAHSHFHRLLHTRYFSWTLGVIGVLIIASPLPDELGVSLLGLSKVGVGKFAAISFLSHSLGIFLITTAGAIIIP